MAHHVKVKLLADEIDSNYGVVLTIEDDVEDADAATDLVDAIYSMVVAINTALGREAIKEID